MHLLLTISRIQNGFDSSISPSELQQYFEDANTPAPKGFWEKVDGIKPSGVIEGIKMGTNGLVQGAT